MARLAIAFAALAIGIALAAPARAGEEPAPEPAAGTKAPTAEEVTTARSLTYGITGLGIAVGVGLAGAGVGSQAGVSTSAGLGIAGAAIAGVAFVAGPSAGWYALGHPLRASLTLGGRLLLLGGAPVLFGYGYAQYGWEGPGAALLAGALVCGVGALGLLIFDFIIPDAPEPAAPENGPAVEVAPTAWIGPNAAGLAAMGTF